MGSTLTSRVVQRPNLRPLVEKPVAAARWAATGIAKGGRPGWRTVQRAAAVWDKFLRRSAFFLQRTGLAALVLVVVALLVARFVEGWRAFVEGTTQTDAGRTSLAIFAILIALASATFSWARALPTADAAVYQRRLAYAAERLLHSALFFLLAAGTQTVLLLAKGLGYLGRPPSDLSLAVAFIVAVVIAGLLGLGVMNVYKGLELINATLWDRLREPPLDVLGTEEDPSARAAPPADGTGSRGAV